MSLPFYLKKQLNLLYGSVFMTKKSDENSMIAVNERIAGQQYDMANRGPEASSMAALLGDGLMKETHTFDGSPEEVWAQIAKCCGADVVQGSTALNERIDLADFYCHEVDFADADTGEVNRGIRTVLIDKSGKMYSFASDGIVRGLLRIVRAFGQQHYKEPMLIKIVQVPVRGKFRTYTIVPG